MPVYDLFIFVLIGLPRARTSSFDNLPPAGRGGMNAEPDCSLRPPQSISVALHSPALVSPNSNFPKLFVPSLSVHLSSQPPSASPPPLHRALPSPFSGESVVCRAFLRQAPILLVSSTSTAVPSCQPRPQTPPGATDSACPMSLPSAHQLRDLKESSCAGLPRSLHDPHPPIPAVVVARSALFCSLELHDKYIR